MPSEKAPLRRARLTLSLEDLLVLADAVDKRLSSLEAELPSLKADSTRAGAAEDQVARLRAVRYRLADYEPTDS